MVLSVTDGHRRSGSRRVLVAEQDRDVRRWLEGLLTSWGFTVTSAADGDSALAVIDEQPVDVAVIDAALPATEPQAVARRLREACALVLVVVQGERPLGDAAEWLAPSRPEKPGPESGAARAAVSHLGDLEIDWRSLNVRRDGEPIDLSQQDLRLLCTLVGHRGHVLSRRTLLGLVWGCDYLGSSRMVDMAIRRLRERLEADPACPRYIHTVRGQGYVFQAPEL